MRLSSLTAAVREIVKPSAGTEAGQPAGNRFFTERRLGWYAAAVAFSYAIITVAVWPVLHPAQGGHCLDFNWIWLTGKLASSHAAAHVYNPAVPLPPDVAASLPQFHCTGTAGDGRFDYPPTILFFTYPVGLLPYAIGMAGWLVATLLLYLAAIYAIVPRMAVLIAALTTYPVVLDILFAHNGFLTAGLVGLALAFTERRPWLAGLFLGLLTYKPQFGILFPFALLASRNWRAFVAASAASMAFAAAAAMAFGFELWLMFLTGMSDEAARLTAPHPTATNIIFPTIRGIVRHAGYAGNLSWIVQAVVAAAVIAIVCALWSRPIPHSLKAAALVVGTLVAAPYALSYDYCVLSIAAAFIVKDCLARGFLRGERMIMLACWGGFSLYAFFGGIVLIALNREFGEAVSYFLLAGIPLVVCAVLMSLVLRRAFLIDPTAREAAPGFQPRMLNAGG